MRAPTKRRRRHQPPLVAAVWLLGAAVCTVSAQTTVPVFLPGYRSFEWTALRGSIITSDASMTTYTVFCAEQTPGPPSCKLDNDLPFNFAEGPDTLSYSGSVPGQLTVDLHCSLAGSTAATCSGFSSLGQGVRRGTLTGPTQTTWKHTFTTVQWGVLTLTTAPSRPATTDLEATGISTAPLQPAPTRVSSVAIATATGADAKSAARRLTIDAALSASMFVGMILVAMMLA